MTKKKRKKTQNGVTSEICIQNIIESGWYITEIHKHATGRYWRGETRRLTFVPPDMTVPERLVIEADNLKALMLGMKKAVDEAMGECRNW